MRSFIWSAYLVSARLIFPGSAWSTELTGPTAAQTTTATPIEHLVVIFQENVSFDHYFGTYPYAANKPGEVAFTAVENTPTVNGLNDVLLTHNPNLSQPVRLDRAHAATCDQDHAYASEEKAMHGGLMDKFVENTGASDAGCDRSLVMAYFDGNTVAALWRYAQNFAMSDNYYGTTFGPSTPGAINLVSGRTHGAAPTKLKSAGNLVIVKGTVVGDADPEFDDCSKGAKFRMSGTNVGDLLNQAGVPWGWFQGGFRPSSLRADGKALCETAHEGSDGKTRRDYVPHHQPFQYYKSTSNPRHLPPSDLTLIGMTDQANHQYDLDDFWIAAGSGSLPAVSFVKAPAYRDGHAGYSDPVAEQIFLTETINRLQELPQWKSMAIVITYDDSDGWYDHAMPPIISQSKTRADALVASGSCGSPAANAYPGRCGHGPRLPLLVVSPFTRTNFVDHTITDQTSILRFIEDNWKLGRIGDQSFDQSAGSMLQLFDFKRKSPASRLFLDPETGLPLQELIRE